jgi:ABC-type lipoprotein release transport system permease subunit
MALRNLSRHRVKTAITTVAVAVSVCLYIFVDAWLLGMNLDSRRNIVVYEMGAAKIQTAAYFAKKDDLPMYESFAGWERIADALAAKGYDAAPRFVFSGTMHSRSGAAPMLFNAVDAEREARLLRYTTFLEAGRFPKPGAFEIAIGSLAAERLRVGIPLRATKEEVEDFALSAQNEADAAFVRGLYLPASSSKKKKEMFAVDDPIKQALHATQLVLKPEASPADIDRLWKLLAASGRMDVRISTTIDIKAAPETIRKDRFETGVLPLLAGGARKRVEAAYGPDPLTGDFILAAADAAEIDAVLADLVAIDYQGAVRHVNQLIDAVVVGVVNSPNPKTNGNIAFIPLDDLQDEAGLMLEGQVTELLVRKTGADDSALPGKDESAAAIAAALGPAPGAAVSAELDRRPSGNGVIAPALGAAPGGALVVRGWKDYVADYFAAANGDNVSTRVMIFFLFLLSFIGIANTMLMAIMERTKETGMLRALGMTDGQVLLAYVIEAGLIGAIGSFFGVLFGCLINIPMVRYGVDYSAIAAEMGGDFGYRIATLFKSAWNPAAIVLTGVFATLLSAAAAVLPSLKALRMAVTESLRFE